MNKSVVTICFLNEKADLAYNKIDGSSYFEEVMSDITHTLRVTITENIKIAQVNNIMVKQYIDIYAENGKESPITVSWEYIYLPVDEL